MTHSLNPKPLTGLTSMQANCDATNTSIIYAVELSKFNASIPNNLSPKGTSN